MGDAMASVMARKLKGGEVWYASVKLRSGKWYSHNTGIPVERDGAGAVRELNRRRAMRAAMELQMAEGNLARPSPFGTAPIKGQELAALFERYYRARADQWGPRTGILHRHTFRAWLELMGQGDVREVTAARVAEFRERLMQRGKRRGKLSAATLNIHLRNLRAFLRWCVEDGTVQHWAMPRIREARVAKQERIDYFEPQELLAVIAAAKAVTLNGKAVAEFIALAVLTGMRRGELMALRKSWIRDAGHTIVLPGSQTKGLKRRVIVVEDSAAQLLNSLTGTDPIFGWATEAVSRRFALACDMAGVRRLRFHNLRDTAAVRWLQMGRSLRAVQMLLGHSSITTTANNYLMLGPEEIQESRREEWAAISTDILRILGID